MKHFKDLLVWLTAATITGCGMVYTTQPIGENPYLIEKETWEGTWTNGENFLTINVLDEKNGLFQIAWIEDDQNPIKLESCKVHLLESGDWVFGSIQDKDNPKRYIWGRIKKNERQIVVWLPDPEKFKTLVGEGRLPGKIGDNEVVLGNLTSKHLKLITSEMEGVLFEWDEPIIFRRLNQ